MLKLIDRPLEAAEIKRDSGIPDEVIKLVLNRMAFEGSLMRVGAESLRSNIIRYVSTKVWANDRFLRADNNEALAWLAGEYLRAFGPARVKDFQWWAGITAGKAKSAISVHDTVNLGNDNLLPAGDLNDFESFTIPGEDSLDILPQWDCYMMGYAPDGRNRFVDRETQHHIYGKLGATSGNGLGAVLVNGRACGSWSSRFSGNRMKVILKMVEKPSGKLNSEITNHFNEIGAFLNAKSAVVEQR